jgi:hypothetical protein
MRKTAIFHLAVLLLAAGPAAAQDTVSFKVTPPAGKTRMAEVFKVGVQATYPQQYSIKPDTASADGSDFGLLSFTKTGGTVSGGLKTETFEIKAQAFALGVSTFPALTWKLSGAPGAAEAGAKSPEFALTILPLFDSKAGGDIRDIRPPYRYTPWLWLLAFALTAAAAFFIYRRFFRRGAAPGASVLWSDARTPYQRARARLDALAKSRLLETARFKEYYIGLTSVLRLYVAGEFSISAELMTTQALARELKRTGAELKTILKTREFLDRADLVKFARFRPEAAAADLKALDEVLMEFTRAAEGARAKAAAEAAARAAGKAS